MTNKRQNFAIISSLGILALLSPFVAAAILPPHLSWSAIVTRGQQNSEIFWDLRLPRTALAFLVGAALSLSGAGFQALLHNPLADPYILGVSGGAALGYVAGLLLGLPAPLMPLAGFTAALISLALIYRSASGAGSLNTAHLLLVGVIFNSFSFAIILLANSLANFGQAQQILYLLLGSIETVSWQEVGILAAFVGVAAFALIARSPALNLLTLGDEEAARLGINVLREKRIVFLASSLMVGATVSLCGLIGFVGLFVPHLLRLLLGADHRKLFPACLAGGGLFLVWGDFLASSIFRSETFATRLPVGVVTALIGAPLFVLLLKRRSAC